METKTEQTIETGAQMHALATRLFPICRSLTGNGVRETLSILQEYIPLTLVEVPTGTTAFDWAVPKEWNIKDAYIVDPAGNKIADFKKSNLHVVGYSTPVTKELSLAELQEHLYSLPEQPNAIPYVTSYYQERWGFCLTHEEREKLTEGTYKVFIDSELKDGALTYGELVIPGKTTEEIFVSTYVCHPSMANNELSGPVVATALAKWVMQAPRKYTYRFVFIPETIGSLVYISKHLPDMKKNIIAGFNLTCVGDNRAYSFLPSRLGRTLADKVAVRVLKKTHSEFTAYSFLERGSDERQYCSPGADLPVVSIMRSKYLTYPEYHTSLDDLTVITPDGLEGAFKTHVACFELLESRQTCKAVFVGEPQLGKRGLYPTVSIKGNKQDARDMVTILAYADGTNDAEDISEITGILPEKIAQLASVLEKNNLLTINGKALE